MFQDAVKELLGVEPHLALTYLMCVIIGVGINWAKRSRELEIGLWQYWRQYPGRTQAALLGTFTAYLFTIITDPESGKLAYMAIGFACDNLLNKAPVGGAAGELLAKQEAALAVQDQRMKELQQATTGNSQ